MNHTEKYFQQFKLKDPPLNLKKSIIKNAQAHWHQQNAIDIPTSLMATIKIVYYSAAAAVVLMLSIAFSNMPKQADVIDLHSKELALLEDIGFPRETAVRIILLEKSKKHPENINILNKEI
ncbi:MAG: hypothetical protein KAS17_07205 [Victivallaceae bacterium]|nr:hypothetical protein [Victivallaceae bacterium]